MTATRWEMATEGAGTRSLRAVALLEAVKGVLALLAAGALLSVGPVALRRWAMDALDTLPASLRGDIRLGVLDRITTETVDVAAALVLAYGLMRLLEGWGLWRHRAWASWLGCIGAAAYVPFEMYALWRHPAWLTWGVLLLNLLIVAVLAHDLARRRR
jgi:uncharacterized membrane protein (DUF2068 family)